MSDSASKIKKAAILFAGGPAPAANAVISAAAVSFLRHGSEVIGIKHGYSPFEKFGPDQPLVEGKHYIKIDHPVLKRTRNSQGILIGTARTNPGKNISHPTHLDDKQLRAPLQKVYDGLRSLGVDALISIGGDDTLKTANKFKLFQDRLPAGSPRIPVVHLPKTIDNDYRGIDFTFGYFTAVDTLAAEIRNLLYDADANRAYFIVECMGRSAGWLAYGAAIAGEASLVISVEDIIGKYRTEETYTDSKTGEQKTRPVMNLDAVLDLIVGTMLARERDGKEYGVIVLAEGLAEYLPMEIIKDVSRDDHGHIAVAEVKLYERAVRLIEERYTARTNGRKRRLRGLQLGYEARCAKPTAFDAMLGSQLGVGGFRALAEKKLDGVMVSLKGQLELCYVPFEELVDPETLVTVVRHIEPGSDFHRLARFLETQLNY
jgi:ATP-dependent phosphofructokinase / diphosphate-dependent phosphofructokinase